MPCPPIHQACRVIPKHVQKMPVDCPSLVQWMSMCIALGKMLYCSNCMVSSTIHWDNLDIFSHRYLYVEQIWGTAYFKRSEILGWIGFLVASNSACAFNVFHYPWLNLFQLLLTSALSPYWWDNCCISSCESLCTSFHYYSYP